MVLKSKISSRVRWYPNNLPHKTCFSTRIFWETINTWWSKKLFLMSSEAFEWLSFFLLKILFVLWIIKTRYFQDLIIHKNVNEPFLQHDINIGDNIWYLQLSIICILTWSHSYKRDLYIGICWDLILLIHILRYPCSKRNITANIIIR